MPRTIQTVEQKEELRCEEVLIDSEDEDDSLDLAYPQPETQTLTSKQVLALLNAAKTQLATLEKIEDSSSQKSSDDQKFQKKTPAPPAVWPSSDPAPKHLLHGYTTRREMARGRYSSPQPPIFQTKPIHRAVQPCTCPNHISLSSLAEEAEYRRLKEELILEYNKKCFENYYAFELQFRKLMHPRNLE